jgi:serine/threonine protein kinase/WD40 repeat protein
MLEIGRLLGGYRLEKQLGAGGMGAVFLAEDVKLQRKVALKVMKPEVAAKKTSRERFLREARAAARLDHIHVVPILQIGEEDGIPFIAMPFLKGEPLDERLKRQRLAVPEVLAIGRQTADGLSAAHKHGLVHRDIKPANIWLESTEDAPLVVKILDFGLARLSGERGQLTQTGAVMGTPAYMAPEQARGLSIDPRADLFSLGVVLYEMATGQRPFKGNDTMAILTSLALDTPPEPIDLEPELPPMLSTLIMRLLEKNPEQRLTSARVAVEVLKTLQPEATVVVMVAPQPAAQPAEASPWADIDASSTNIVEAPVPLPRLPRGAKGSRSGMQPVGSSSAVPSGGPGSGAPTECPDSASPAKSRGDRRKTATSVSSRRSGRARSKKPLLFFGAGVFGALVATIIVLMMRDKGSSVADTKPPDLPPTPVVAAPSGAKIPAIELADFEAAHLPAPPELISVLGENRGGHQSFPNTVVVSPDGKWAVSASADSLILWDTTTMRQRWKKLPKPGDFRCVAFTPDGAQLVVGTGASLLLFDANSGEEQRRATTLAGVFSCVAVSADGKQVLAGLVGKERNAVLYNLKTWAEVRPLTGHTSNVNAVAFSLDGKRGLTGSEDGTARVWDLANGKELQQFGPKDKYPMASVAFAPDGKRAMFCNNRQMSLAEVATGKVLFATPSIYPSGPAILAPNGLQAAQRVPFKDAQGVDRTAIVWWDLDRGQEFRRFVGHSDVVTSLAITKDGQRLLSAGRDLTVRLWDVESGNELLPRQQGHASKVTALAFAPDSKSLMSGSWDCSIRVWDLTGAAPKERQVLRTPEQAAGSLAFSTDGKKLGMAHLADADHPVRVWDLSRAEPLEWARTDKRARFKQVMFLPDGNRLAAAFGSLALYDLTAPELKLNRQLDVDKIAGPLAVSPDGKHLGCLREGGDGPYLVDLTAPAALKPVRLPYQHAGRGLISLAFSRDNRWLAGAAEDGFVHFWDLSTPDREEANAAKVRIVPANQEGPAPAALAFSPDGKTLIWKDRGRLMLWDWAAKRKLKEWRLPGTDEIFAVAPDGGLLAVATDKGAVFLLRLDVPVAEPSAFEDWVQAIAVLPAEQQVQAVQARLRERNPEFDGHMTPTYSNGEVTELALKSMFVRDLSALAAFPALQVLNCKDGDRPRIRGLADLSSLKGLKLTRLDISNTAASDLTPLKEIRLTSLICRGTRVATLAPLKGLTLTELNCSATNVADLTPLKDTRLTNLNCGDTAVRDLSPLGDLRLTVLNCDGTAVSDLSPLKDMKLTSLSCRNTAVSNLAPLKDMKLTSFSCAGTPVSDLTPLKSMPLTTLDCTNTKVTNLAPLTGMPLKTLDCDFNAARDASILRSIKTLEKINGQNVIDLWKKLDGKE